MIRKFASINRAEMKWVLTPLELNIKFGVILRMRCQNLSPINLFSDISDIFARRKRRKGFLREFSPRKIAAKSAIYQKNKLNTLSIHQQSVNFRG